MARFKPSKKQAREFARQMSEISDFCRDHGIVQSYAGDSYYFTVNGKRYRVSNHTIERSDATRAAHGLEPWHNGRDQDTIYITASKTRIIEIYNALSAGLELDGRGYVKEV